MEGQKYDLSLNKARLGKARPLLIVPFKKS